MKKQSLKSNLFAMEQYEIVGDNVYGGYNDQTSNKQNGSDHYKSNTIADTFTDFIADTSNNFGSDMATNPNENLSTSSTTSSINIG